MGTVTVRLVVVAPVIVARTAPNQPGSLDALAEKFAPVMVLAEPTEAALVLREVMVGCALQPAVLKRVTSSLSAATASCNCREALLYCCNDTEDRRATSVKFTMAPLICCAP